MLCIHHVHCASIMSSRILPQRAHARVNILIVILFNVIGYIDRQRDIKITYTRIDIYDRGHVCWTGGHPSPNLNTSVAETGKETL